jgi:hypothetical protein
MSKGERMPHAVIAAARDDARFKAVEVRKHDNAVEILWARSLPAEGQTWTAFAAACGVAPGADGHEKAKKHVPSVVGLDSTGVVFYRVAAPAVEQQELAAIVRMQVESLLPLPADQIEVAWRTAPSTNGNVEITIAAARREFLHKFADSVHDFRPSQIMLSCEGLAKAWQSLFSERQRQAVLVSVAAENTPVCLVQNGSVTHAAVLSSGMADLAGPGGAASPVDPGVSALPQSIERFAQDLRAVLGSFGWDESGGWPLLVLSDGSEVMNRLVESLHASGLPAKASVPEVRNVKLPAGFLAQDVYAYRTPLGLALLALEKPAGTLNLFERIVRDKEQARTLSAWRSVVLAGAVAAVVLIALLVTMYFTDVASAQRWSELASRPDFETLRQQQTMLRTVARYRPDLLQLLVDINAGKNDGVALDAFHFKKGQLVTIAGQAGSMEQLWAFEKNLRGHKDFKEIKILNSAPDNKTKKIKFTITFSYKTFSKKEAIL